MKTFDVAIIGGGLIGAAAALELRSRKLEIVVLDRQQPGREASWAAAGMLAPGPDHPGSEALVPLSKKSLELYPEFIEAVERASRQSTGFVRQPTIQAFFGSSGKAERDEFVALHERLGIPAEPISVRAARELERPLSRAITAAALLPEEAAVDPRFLIDATISAATALGVEIRANCCATGLNVERGRCVGVVTDKGEIAAGHVLLAAGCFSGDALPEISRLAPTRPVRGQMLALRNPEVELGRVLRSSNGYLVPRAGGRILAGSTLENAGFEKVVTEAGAQKILMAALEIVPALSDAEVVEHWAGLRPGSPDDLPILGPTDIEGLLIATGHYRNGILLAPVTAKLVAAWVLSEPTPVDARIFSPLRFDRRAGSSPG
ncbi:MAG TPA: glycine oxidase ThiO [Candidatus Acidoferrales bacterium]|nr:glycine oxidase ThiO [Candidatus Acidoferrales bacterium]